MLLLKTEKQQTCFEVNSKNKIKDELISSVGTKLKMML